MKLEKAKTLICKKYLGQEPNELPFDLANIKSKVFRQHQYLSFQLLISSLDDDIEEYYQGNTNNKTKETFLTGENGHSIVFHLWGNGDNLELLSVGEKNQLEQKLNGKSSRFESIWINKESNSSQFGMDYEVYVQSDEIDFEFIDTIAKKYFQDVDAVSQEIKAYVSDRKR